MNKGKSRNLIYGIILLLVIWYFALFPLNLTSPRLYFMLFVCAIYFTLTNKPLVTIYKPNKKVSFKQFKTFKWFGYAILVYIGINIIFSPLVQSKAYATWTTIQDGTFKEDVDPVDLNNLTLIDKESSMRLGDRVLGDIPEYVSQFSVSDAYTTVTIDGHLYRVTPLEYNSFIKYLANKKEGTPGYIMVDSTTGDAKLIRVDGGLHYLDSGYFSKDLRRHLVTNYPTKILSQSHFEVDEDLNPFFITSILKYHGIGIRPTVEGIVVTNATTGENIEYNVNDVPTWIDHVYPSELQVKMLNANLMYQGGFINSIIGQKNVRQLTPSFTISSDESDSISYAGYQYLARGNDVCLYSGVTSTTSDESNLGFVISNLRTGETHYYPCSGAEEYSAMASARGLVQEKNYDATFPLLLNLYGRPTYLVTLKDKAGLVKMYAFVDPQDYQKVYASDANDGIEYACKKYLAMIDEDGSIQNEDRILQTLTGEIEDVRPITIDGTTYYYFHFVNDETPYRIEAKVVPFLKINDSVEIQIDESGQVDSLTIK